jgi:hypothetical protein
MSVLDLMRLADVPLTIVRAFEAGKLRFRRISPRSSEPNRWEMIERRLAVPCWFPLRARLKHFCTDGIQPPVLLCQDFGTSARGRTMK